MVEIAYLLLGIMAGILSGLFGIGGGIVMVPSLIAFFGMEILDANATSLAAMLLPVGIFGVIAYYKAGLVNVKESLWIALGLFAGSFVGGELAIIINESLLAKIYASILLYISISYFGVFKYFKKTKTEQPTPSINKKYNFKAFILVGLVAGVFAGLFGKGGGIIIVPMLIGFFHYDGKAATATSLTAMQLPVGLPSVMIYAHNGHLNIIIASLIALGIVFGVFLGTKVGINLPSPMFKKVYAVFLFVVSIYMIYKYI